LKRKSLSLKTQMILPTSLVFVFFISALVLSAYLLYSSNVTENSNAQMEATSQQVLANYETYFDSVISVSDSVINEYGKLDKNSKTTESHMQDYFDTIKTFKSEILEMSLYKSSDGSHIASDSSTSYNGDVTSETWFSQANEYPLINVFSRVYENQRPNVDYSFTLSRHVSYDKDNSLDAVLKVDFDFAKIVDSIPPTTLGSDGRFTIYDKNYAIVYSSSKNSLDEEVSLIKDVVVGSSNIRFLDHDFYLYAATITNTSWRVAIFINSDAVSNAITSFSLWISLIGLVIMALAILTFLLVSNSVTHPIKQLQKEMADIESLNYGATLHSIKGPKEVEELNESFQSMMKRIEELTNSVVSEKEEQRRSELKALQNQINPHFLYNTLDSIIAMIDKGDDTKAEEMIVALSKFFRISISKGRDTIPLLNEVEHARNYMLIQKMRFGDSFSYDIDVEKGLENYYVVKLILQPIVENSIGHGLKEDEQGHISIKAYSEEDNIRFDVSDNGYGMTPAKVKELEDSLTDKSIYNGVGLKNVYQRVRIYYGEKANLLIKSIEDSGTTISIIIPKEGAIAHEEK
jgi:two-component system sensor histidine kinase YesM